MTDSEIFYKAAEICADGWWQNGYENVDATRFCTAGGMACAITVSGLFNPAMPILRSHSILRKFDSRFVDDTFDWNDAKERTQDEVVTFLLLCSEATKC